MPVARRATISVFFNVQYNPIAKKRGTRMGIEICQTWTIISLRSPTTSAAVNSKFHFPLLSMIKLCRLAQDVKILLDVVRFVSRVS
jgi:hypothetical protein